MAIRTGFLFLLGGAFLILLSGCETFEETATTDPAPPPVMGESPPETEMITVHSSSEPKEEEAPTTEPETPEQTTARSATMPAMPSGRDDLNDPRMLAAAQMVGAMPQASEGGEAAAPQPRNDLTDPRMLAAARAAGITIPGEEPEPEPEPVVSAEPEPAVVSEPEVPKKTAVAASVEKPTAAPASATPSPKALPAKAPVASVDPVAPRVEPVKKPARPAKPVVATPAPQQREYPISAPDARMIPFYEKQLDRENLDPIIRAYYERKLAEAKGSNSEETP